MSRQPNPYPTTAPDHEGDFMSRSATAEKTRATVALSETLHDTVSRAAAELGISVPDYIRRALAFQSRLDRYMTDDGELIVVDPSREKEIHLQLVS